MHCNLQTAFCLINGSVIFESGINNSANFSYVVHKPMIVTDIAPLTLKSLLL